MKLPTFSVITPSYNQGHFIRETIESVLSQEYPFLEYIVMDGGSTDETVSILKSYGNQISWESKKDSGQPDAINKGMKRATGDIVCYLNSDDVLLPQAIKRVARQFLDNPEALWVSGDYQIINESGKLIQPGIRQYKRFFRHLDQHWLLYIINYINQPSTFWQRSVFNQIGYFDESLHYCMDYDFWLRLIKLQPPVILEHDLSQFRIHTTSKGNTGFDIQFSEEFNVMKRYTTNPVLSTLHKLHATATVQAYHLLK